MKFLKLLIIIIACFILFPAMLFIFSGTGSIPLPVFGIIVLIFVVLLILIKIAQHINRKTLPGGVRGAALQGIWVLEKNLRFEPVLKKWEAVPVEPEKNYFEFKGNNFRSGDFDEKHRQLPAEYSPFLVENDNIIIESEFFKKANLKWAIKKGRLELTIETATPKNSKSQFIFYRKNWA